MKKIIILLLLFSIYTTALFSDCISVPPLLSIIPGGGQVYNKSYVKASIIAGTETTLMYLLYNTYKNTHTINTYLLYGIIAVKLYSIIDAYIDAEMKEPINIGKWKRNTQKQ